MDVRLVPVKIKQRLNKQNSFDFDNLECWQIIEAFNKAQLEWFRNALKGLNLNRAGDEVTSQITDDLQIFLTTRTLKGVTKNYFFESENLPSDYFSLKRVTVFASKDECKYERLKCKQVEEANVDIYLNDPHMTPSFAWRECFFTLLGNKVRVYTNSDFSVNDLDLIYYRFPKKISLSGCKDESGLPGTNIDPEFADDVVEIIIDQAAAIIAADIQDLNETQILSQRVDKNS